MNSIISIEGMYSRKKGVYLQLIIFRGHAHISNNIHPMQMAQFQEKGCTHTDYCCMCFTVQLSLVYLLFINK